MYRLLVMVLFLGPFATRYAHAENQNGHACEINLGPLDLRPALSVFENLGNTKELVDRFVGDLAAVRNAVIAKGVTSRLTVESITSGGKLWTRIELILSMDRYTYNDTPAIGDAVAQMTWQFQKMNSRGQLTMTANTNSLPKTVSPEEIARAAAAHACGRPMPRGRI